MHQVVSSRQEMIRESPERKDGTEKRKDPERGCEGVVGRVDLGK